MVLYRNLAWNCRANIRICSKAANIGMGNNLTTHKGTCFLRENNELRCLGCTSARGRGSRRARGRVTGRVRVFVIEYYGI